MAVTKDWLPTTREGILAMAKDWISAILILEKSDKIEGWDGE